MHSKSTITRCVDNLFVVQRYSFYSNLTVCFTFEFGFPGTRQVFLVLQSSTCLPGTVVKKIFRVLRQTNNDTFSRRASSKSPATVILTLCPKISGQCLTDR